jgi:4-amino-4-deoxy-L-arabinose transferase-like glycosyltransferase
MNDAITALRRPRTVAWLILLFLVALLPRGYSAQQVGWHWDHPGSFTLVNFDEAGSCRAALHGFDYTPFVGHQTIALATLLGHAPPAGILGNERAVKAYCHSPAHIRVARSYAAVAGALTVVLTAVLGFLLVPGAPAVGWTAAALLALSGVHIGQSFSGTVDAPSTFFIYLFLTVLAVAVTRGSRLRLAASVPLAVLAVWTKYWVFALLAYLALLPARAWHYLSHGLTLQHRVLMVLGAAALFGLMSNLEFRTQGAYVVFALWYALVPWGRIKRPMAVVWLLVPPLIYALGQVDVIERFTMGSAEGRFGTGYAAIGWHKWPRNFLNLPLYLLVSLGIPACLCLIHGVRLLLRGQGAVRAWCCLLPLLAFALFMVFVSPITYYRHYLPLLPVAAILSAWGFCALAGHTRRGLLALFLLWPALLAVDLVVDYHQDPRIALRQWSAQHPDAAVFSSFYVNPPPGRYHLFHPEYAAGDAPALRQGDYLVLSESWYDTAFASELNGPFVHEPARLVKTTPAYAAFYRTAIAGQHPLLQPLLTLPVHSFMPELLFHRSVYGNVQLFVGDLRIFEIVQ